MSTKELPIYDPLRIGLSQLAADLDGAPYPPIVWTCALWPVIAGVCGAVEIGVGVYDMTE